MCRLDPVTAGPGDIEDSPSPLDHMTEEEKEIEAEKLAELFDKLNRYCYSNTVDSRYSGSLKYGHLDIPAIILVWHGLLAK